MGGSRILRVLAAAGLAVVGVGACDPPPPRLQLVVDSAAMGSDDDPGDGVCSSAASGGACTLRAAIEEGNAAPDGADVTLSVGQHHRGVDVTVTGDVALAAAPGGQVAITDSTFTVAAGGRLALTGVNTSTGIRAEPPSSDPPVTSVSLLRLHVAGRAEVARSFVGGLQIDATGEAVLADSAVDSSVTTNHGRLVALRSSFFGSAANGPGGSVLVTMPGGATHLAASVLAVPHVDTSLGLQFPGGQGTCSGAAPASASHLFVEVPCGPLAQPGDGSGDAGTTLDLTIVFTGIGYQQVGSAHGLRPTSPLVDAVPVGGGACPEGSVDVYGQPRGVDGDGDGEGGCDVGAVERRP